MDYVTEIERTVSKVKYQHYLEAFFDLTAGSAGGISCVLVGQPLDTIKVKMQTFPDIYKNSFQCFKQTVLKENLRGLYAGTVPALVANVAENSVLFCAYGVCQSAVKLAVKKQKVEHLNPLENACAGFLAAFFSSFTLCPTELVKCRLQAMREMALKSNATSLRIGPWSMTKSILQTEGVAGLFHGLVPTFAREMPGYFFFFGGYEITRVMLTSRGESKSDIGLVKTVIAGGVGGAALWTAIFPFDVVKSRVQISGSKQPMIDVLKDILRKEGFRGLYKGLGPTLLRTFPASGALFVAYEYTVKVLHYVSGIERS